MFIERCSDRMRTLKTGWRIYAIRFCIFSRWLIMHGMEEMFPLESSWIVALAAGAVALIMLLELARSLPGQNIALIAASLLAGEGLLEFFTVRYFRTDVTGPMWCFLAGAALLWLAVVLAARRLGQLILRPWRRGKYYGLWLIGWSTVATAVFQFGWPGLDPDFSEMPKAAILAGIRGAATLVFLTCLAPWFIRKRPVSPPDPSELAQQPKDKAQ
jgi:hypothetical protein